MKSINLSGFPRESVGKKESRALRNEGKVPCVLYGGEEQVHFWSFGYDLKGILYNPNTFVVKVNINGKVYDTIVKESQFHAVNDGILHVDFLALNEGKPVTVDLPIAYDGVAPGTRVGGKFISRLRKLSVRALPTDLPDHVHVDVNDLELGKSIRVKDIPAEGFVILNSPNNPVCSVIVPRAARAELEDEELEGVEGEEVEGEGEQAEGAE